MYVDFNPLAVNLDSVCPSDCAYIGTNNNGDEIPAWIVWHGPAVPTGHYGYRGYRRYPEYRFCPEILQEPDPDGYSEYLHGCGKRYGKESKEIKRNP